MTPEEIVAREFLQKTGAKHVTATYDSDSEIWTIVADGVTYTMEVGSDDDCFVFVASDGRHVEMPFSDEYLAAKCMRQGTFLDA